MGVEPTVAASVAPTYGFEDRGAHRGPTTPAFMRYYTRLISFKQVHNR